MKMVGEPGSMPRALADAVIAEILEKDPERVIRAVDSVVERFKSQRRYSPEEIDAAAAQVCKGLGIPWKSRLN